MTRALFAFLGANPYVPVRYALDGRTAEAELYVQAALVRLLEPAPDHVYVALTAKVRGHENWRGLEARLGELGYRAPERLTALDVPDGQSEEELWRIFDRLAALGAGEVVVDLTHGFRTLPLVASLALPFHAQAKGFEIVRAVYGAFETLGEAREVRARYDATKVPEVAPVFDLTPMFALPVWTQAVAEWERTGRARGLEERLREPVRALGRLLGQAAPRELGRLPAKLGALSDALAVVKIDDVPARAADVVAILDGAAEQIGLHPGAMSLRPFQAIVDQLRASIVALVRRPGEDTLAPAVRLADWYLERERYPEAYTALREALSGAIVVFAARCGIDAVLSDDGRPSGPGTVGYRQRVDGLVLALASGRSRADGDPVAARLDQALAAAPDVRSALALADSVRERRNKIDHAWIGYRDNLARDPKTQRLAIHDTARADVERVARVVALVTEGGVFVNLSNHPVASWTAPQLGAADALGFGSARDLPGGMPLVPADATAEAVGALADALVARSLAAGARGAAVFGEASLTHALVTRLEEVGVRCFAPTTERVSSVTGEGDKVERRSVFQFVQWRRFGGTAKEV